RFEDELSGLELSGDGGEPGVDYLDLVVGDHADPVQGTGVGPGLGNVIRSQVPVEIDRPVEPPEAGVRRFTETRSRFVGVPCHGADYYPGGISLRRALQSGR